MLRRAVLLPILAAAVFCLSGCKLPGAKSSAVPLETVTKGDVVVKVDSQGTIEPLSKVDIKSKVAGRILHLYVHEGEQVHRGQIMATIDPQEIDSQVDALRAQLLSARAQQAAAEKNLQYQQQQTNAAIEQNMQNVNMLRAQLKQTLTQSNVQPHLTSEAIHAAKANLAAAQAQYQAQVDALNLMKNSTDPNNVVSAQSAYDQAKAQAANALITLKRQQSLEKKGYVAMQAVDSALAAWQVAEAQQRDASQKLSSIRQANVLQEANQSSQVRAAAAQVAQSDAALAQAEADTLPSTRRDAVSAMRASLAQARAQLASARSSVLQNKIRADDLAAAAANVQQIQNQLDVQLVQQHDTTLYSPMDGIVTKRYVEVGDLITSAISSFSSGTPVYQVADLNTMLVKIQVNEVDIDKIEPGMPTEVRVDAVPGVMFHGQVDKVAPAAANYTAQSSSSTASSSDVVRFPVEIRISHADKRLHPGMTARCTVIVAKHSNVIRVPADAVEGTGVHAVVTVMKNSMQAGKSVRVPEAQQVVTGLHSSSFVEIVSGLSPGESIQPAPYTGPPRQGINMQANVN